MNNNYNGTYSTPRFLCQQIQGIRIRPANLDRNRGRNCHPRESNYVFKGRLVQDISIIDGLINSIKPIINYGNNINATEPELTTTSPTEQQ